MLVARGEFERVQRHAERHHRWHAYSREPVQSVANVLHRRDDAGHVHGDVVDIEPDGDADCLPVRDRTVGDALDTAGNVGQIAL